MINFFNNSYNNENSTSTDDSNQSLNEKISLKRGSIVVSDENNLENNQTQINKIYENEMPVNINATMDFDTLQKAYQDLIGEIQTINEYDEHIRNTNDRFAREMWENIKNEELTHAGGLMALINYLDPAQKQYVQKGWNEFNERLNKK